jgi:hypothetical protein
MSIFVVGKTTFNTTSLNCGQMQDVILNDRYKYVFDRKLRRYIINIDGVPSPLYPKQIFKFYGLSLNSLAALHENYFWLSNPKDFNDPFDCNINLVEYPGISFKNAKETHPRNDIGNIGVTCFTEEINEALLWAHYAQNYTGFAIEFNSKTLRVNIDDQSRKHTLNPVLYFDKFISVKHTDSFALEYLLSAKSKNWSYEKEWRFLCDIEKEKPCSRIIFYEPIAVKALYIGYKCFHEHESTFNLIESIFTRKYPKKPVYIVHPHKSKLELCFTKRGYVRNPTS